MSSAGLMINGPKMDWTRDNKMYERYLQWKKRCEMIFNSALKPQDESIKCEYLKYWLGTEGLPLIEKWENTRKLVYVILPLLPGVIVTWMRLTMPKPRYTS